MYIVYIIRNEKGIFYKGLTSNLTRRLKEHNSNKNFSTKNKGPWKLIHAELFDKRGNARKAELFFKSGIGREIIKEIYSSVAQR